jgi:hypothetical protein
MDPETSDNGPVDEGVMQYERGNGKKMLITCYSTQMPVCAQWRLQVDGTRSQARRMLVKASDRLDK